MVTRDRIEMGAVMLNKHAALLREVERQYGVPAEIIVSIWGIESSFGGFTAWRLGCCATLHANNKHGIRGLGV